MQGCKQKKAFAYFAVHNPVALFRRVPRGHLFNLLVGGEPDCFFTRALYWREVSRVKSAE